MSIWFQVTEHQAHGQPIHSPQNQVVCGVTCKNLEEVKLAEPAARDVIGDVVFLDAIYSKQKDNGNPVQYKFTVDIIFEGPSAKVQKNTALASCLLTAAARIHANPDVRFFLLTNRSEDGQERPVYDEDNLPFYDGLCVQPLDHNLQPVGRPLPVPPKDYQLPVSPGAADPWLCIKWSLKRPRGATSPVAAKSGPSASRRKRPKQHEGSPQSTFMECSPPDSLFAATVPSMLQQLLTQGQAQASVPAGEEEVINEADVHEAARRKNWIM